MAVTPSPLTRPAEPIELAGTDDHFGGPAADTPPELVAALGAICPTDDSVGATARVSRDWWPISMHWALAGEVPRRAGAVVRPQSTEQVSAVASLCNAARVPLTVAAGRSGVCGASVPVFGGVVLDTTAMQAVVSVDAVSGIVEVLPGTFGPDLERTLRDDHGLSVGHIPQSIDISTVGGWVACRGAGQYSTRYGKIEDMVVGLEVVLADGRVIHTGGSPAAACGPDLTSLFVGCEGTLGILTRIWLTAHPVPPAERRRAYSCPSFAAGVDACRMILRRGATPAVLRLYDAVESERSHDGDGTSCVLLVLDEGDPLLVDAVMGVVDDVARRTGAQDLGDELVGRWMLHRNDTSALQALTRKGLVVDTMEIAAPWSRITSLVEAVARALTDVAHTRVASVHLSHSYTDGACLYFTFAAAPPPELVDATYVALWDAGQRAALTNGGNLSHHHGVGVNRGRFVADALGPAHAVLVALKQALDPAGILNPGKLGLGSPFGAVAAPFGPATVDP